MLERVGRLFEIERLSCSYACFSSAERSDGGGLAGLERLGDVGGNGAGQVDVNAEQFRRRLFGHHIRDIPAPIAALRDKLRVSKALHQHDPGPCDMGRIPAGRGRLARKAVARHRRNHQMERIRCARRRAPWDWSADRRSSAAR